MVETPVRRSLIASWCLAALSGCLDTSEAGQAELPRPPRQPAPAAEPDVQPNVLFVFADDLGYGDLGVYGSDSVETPVLDGLAGQGVLFTQAYVANSTCTPSRAALLTGRYGPRMRIPGRNQGVYSPNSTQGLELSELTIAELLSEAGYATALVGKWHLGHAPDVLPTRQGFDEFFGLPYSNNMAPLRLMDGDRMLERLDTETDLVRTLGRHDKLASLTERYTERALAFVRKAHAASRPFFLYYATHLPHTPLAASPAFVGHSPTCEELGVKQACGLYADVIAELDFSVGRILDELDFLGIRHDTLVVFSSDNGPWLYQEHHGGSAGGLREGKDTVFEGGFRVPLIVSFPGRFREGAIEHTPVTMMDWLPTITDEAGISLPPNRIFDGKSLAPLLRGNGPRLETGTPFRFIYYYKDAQTPGAYREGSWKYFAKSKALFSKPLGIQHGEMLFDLVADPAETRDLSHSRPDILATLRQSMLELHEEMSAEEAHPSP